MGKKTKRLRGDEVMEVLRRLCGARCRPNHQRGARERQTWPGGCADAP